MQVFETEMTPTRDEPELAVVDVTTAEHKPLLVLCPLIEEPAQTVDPTLTEQLLAQFDWHIVVHAEALHDVPV